VRSRFSSSDMEVAGIEAGQFLEARPVADRHIPSGKADQASRIDIALSRLH